MQFIAEAPYKMPTLPPRTSANSRKGTVTLSLTDWDHLWWYRCWPRGDTALALCCHGPVRAELLCKRGWVYQLCFWAGVSPSFPLPLPGERTGQRTRLLIFMILGKSFPLGIGFSMGGMRVVRGLGSQRVSRFASIAVTQCHHQSQ